MELTVSLPHGEERLAMVGSAERNLKIIRDNLGVKVTARNGSLRISGESRAVARAAQVLEQLSEAARRRQPLHVDQLLRAVSATDDGPPFRDLADAPAGRAALASARRSSPADAVRNLGGPTLEVYARGRQVRPMTPGQQAYLQAISHHDLTLCAGPAGTGKTYLAVAAGVAMLKRGAVRKLVLVRPAVEAGEKLGFLPGTMQEKVNPYLRPLLDALHDMMDFEQIQRFMSCDLIEIIPLAFMRGRTLNDALVILDEAQNTTCQQMLMFLTRLGHGSKMIVTGDTSQIDLEDPTRSGLVDAARRLRHVPGIAFVTLAQADIVRHSLVQHIVDAYGTLPATRPRHPADAQAHDQQQPPPSGP